MLKVCTCTTNSTCNLTILITFCVFPLTSLLSLPLSFLHSSPSLLSFSLSLSPNPPFLSLLFLLLPPHPPLFPPSSSYPSELHTCVDDNLERLYQLYSQLSPDKQDLATRWTDFYEQTLLFRYGKLELCGYMDI